MPTVAEWSRRTYPAPLGAGGVGSIPANSDAQQNVPSFRRWRFEMKLSPFFFFAFQSLAVLPVLFKAAGAGQGAAAPEDVKVLALREGEERLMAEGG